MRDAFRLLLAYPGGRPLHPVGAAGLFAFPLVGVLVGLAWVLASRTIEVYSPTTVAAALVLGADAIVTGARHLDAAGRLAERRGGVAATPVLLLTLVRFGVLMFIVDFGWALLAAPVAGRAGMLGGVAVLRRDMRSVDPGDRWLPALLFALAISVLPVVVVAGPRGVVSLGAAVLAGLAGGAWLRLQGTDPGVGEADDGVFALCLLAETVALLALAAR